MSEAEKRYIWGKPLGGGWELIEEKGNELIAFRSTYKRYDANSLEELYRAIGEDVVAGIYGDTKSIKKKQSKK